MQHIANAETLVAKTARALSDLSLGTEKGHYLGSEDDLLHRLGVSRPTLRQAAKIAESERMIAVRRGIRGGFYAERPDVADSIKALARFLRLNGATMRDVFVVSSPVAQEAGALAATCTDTALRKTLEEFVARIDANDTAGSLIRAEGELARLLAQMSGNPAVQLVMEIGYTFGMEERSGRFFSTPEERAAARHLQHSLCKAVLSGDSDVARVMMRRRSQMISGWFGDEPQP
jgi:GntR family transcriptional regulator, transcriptional repressor for pyruvate dehydrogenase complex